jgi:type I restriction enzyme S subunit
MSRLLLPPRALLEIFAHHVQTIMDRVHQNEQENRTLAALRDTLLPKLISGELRLPDAEQSLGGTPDAHP